MLSKAKIKLIRSLEMKKFRNELDAFVAEGNKLVGDILPVCDCELLLAQPEWLAVHPQLPASVKEVIEVSEEELRKASLLKNPQQVLGVFKRPMADLRQVAPERELVLALDGIQDPGNLGTIVRLADWFGITHIVCSCDTADLFSPKTVQATMGAVARIAVHYTDLAAFLQAQHAAGTPIYGTFLDGTDMYQKTLSPHGVLIMGNEGNGIRKEVEACVNERLYIPNYPAGRETSESLNVAIATAIVCAEFRRRG